MSAPAKKSFSSASCSILTCRAIRSTGGSTVKYVGGSLAELPFHVAGRYPKPALVGRCTPDGVNVASSREFFERIRDFSLGLKDIGVGPGSRVALICETRPEWMVADLGVLTAGAVTVPIYPTLPADRVRYILADAGVSAVVASDEEQAAKVASVSTTDALLSSTT